MRQWLVILGTLLLAGCGRTPEANPEPKQENGSKRGQVVEMKKAAQVQIGLSTTPAAVQTLEEYLNVTGTVQPVDTKVAHVRPLARGRVHDVLAAVGDRVSQGQTLARFDNMEAGELVADLEKAQAELRRLKVAHAAAERQLERHRRLSELGAVPRKDLEASQSEEQAAREAIQAQESVAAGLRSRLERFGVSTGRGAVPIGNINAPIPGIVIAVTTAPGDVIDSGKELFTVADLCPVWVQAEVYEKDIGRIRTGQTAIVEVDTYGHRQFLGKVAYIGDVVDAKTRTVKVRCELPNAERLLKLDMFATVNLPTTAKRTGIAIPESALQQHEGKTIAFVQRGDETFEVRSVRRGMTANGFTEVLAGVAVGERVVTEGAFHLKSVLLEGRIGKEE